MSFKDLFSAHSDEYKRFRPTYPKALFAFLAEQVQDQIAVWDCGTGSGQGAQGLAQYFDQVYATDASATQVEQAESSENITYSVATAEHSGLPDHSVSMVTVFQALHWFELDKFFDEVKRVLIPGGVLAVVGYNTVITGNAAVDKAYHDFCFDYLWEKKCWAMERGSLNASYENVRFPFSEIKAPPFETEMQWDLQDYLSYLNTWSAVKAHIKLYDENPVETFILPRIQDHWADPSQPKRVKFPLILRIGRF